MMRHSLLNRLLLLALSAMLLMCGTAFADPCVQCGQDAGDDAYLCTACLLQLLEVQDLSGGLTLDQPIVNEDGSVTLAWQDEGGMAPYNVYYKLLSASPIPFGWTAASGVQTCAYTFRQLVPGMSYTLVVEDAEGHKAECNYYAPVPGEDHQIGARIRFKTMVRNEAKRTTSNRPFSAAEIMQDNGITHGLYLRLTYSQLIRTRYYAFCITVEAPNGFADVIFSGDLELSHGVSAIPVWGFIPLDSYFDMLTDYYGGVPAGEYLVTMHFNGNVVDQKTFVMGE